MKKVWKSVLMLIATLTLSFSSVMPTVQAATDDSNATSSSVSSNKLAEIKAQGKLVVGTSADYPPMEFVVKKNGKDKIVGADIMVAQKIADDLGVKLVVKDMSFDSLLVALETGKVDMVLAGMNASPERKKSVDFSHTYYHGGNVFLINKSDAKKIKSGKDLAHAKIGAQTGSLQYQMVKKNMKQATMKPLDNINNLVLALKTHKTQGIMLDSLIAKAFVANDSDLKMVKDIDMPDNKSVGVAVAMPKNNPDLVAAVNQTVDEINAKDLMNKEYIPAAGKQMEKVNVKKTMWDYKSFFLKGVGYTLVIAATSVFFGFILGILLSLMRLSKVKVLHAIAVVYIEFIRGTPLMVQIMFIYFGIGSLISSLPAMLAGIIAISLNSGAYVAEIMRSGIQSIHYGQTEAARSLGMSQKMTFQYVVLPQAIKNIWPALGNEFITLVKDSSLVSTIGVAELMYQTQLVQSTTYKGVAPLAVTMCIYFVLTFTLSKILSHYEGKMSHHG
ncbi:MAG: ABC transporter substrate-binding protein/permease [Limosilactobacillus sp.]|nr:ABC transporter substrate-binding protein/permease [Limosilactobacillus sp.]